MINGSVDFIARIYYLTTEEGGRQTPALSKYRPGVKFSFSKYTSSGEQTFLNKEIVYPGDPVDAEIRLLSPHFFEKMLFEGIQFEILEGPKLLGTGTVLEITNKNLLKT
jgi:elongation factor Tu